MCGGGLHAAAADLSLRSTLSLSQTGKNREQVALIRTPSPLAEEKGALLLKRGGETQLSGHEGLR